MQIDFQMAIEKIGRMWYNILVIRTSVLLTVGA